MAEVDYSAWFIGKTFSTDWTSHNFPIWTSLFAARRYQVRSVLEIGSWEGRSAIFFANYMPHCRVTTIDTFTGSPEHARNPKWAEAVSGLEQRFDANVAEFGSRLEKIKSTSYEGLAHLARALRRFDLVYLDGSHRSTDVYADAAMSWPMLVRGGILIFDDYEWPLMVAEIDRPKLGVDAFLAAQQEQYRELHRGYQLIIEKT